MTDNTESKKIPEGFESLISALEATKRPFYCAGSLPFDENKPIAILVQDASGDLPPKFTPVSFPLKNKSDIVPLINASSQASFGKRGEEVFDPSYRRALVLQKKDFAIYPAGSLDPHDLGILNSISRMLLPSFSLLTKNLTDRPDIYYTVDEDEDVGGARIIARLDKLNVYSEGDFFGGRVGAARSSDMFGTLLVNLPVRHEGGQLVVRAPTITGNDTDLKRDEYTTKWGSGTDLEWIAFFSDCEHEVLPVTSGHRVTLTFTLSFDYPNNGAEPFGAEIVAKSRDPKIELLHRALTAPGIFTKDHPRLCFHLEHRYPIDGMSDMADSVKHKLKGRDAVLYHLLVQTGVTVTFHHVLFPGDPEYCGLLSEDDEGEVCAILPRSVDQLDAWGEESESGLNGIVICQGGRSPRQLGMIEVTGNPQFFVRVDYVVHGNEPASVHADYGTVCMVATMQGYDIDEPWGKDKPKKNPYRYY
ncbi:uncharacterized protein EI90DRAFT_3011932 [Cantharellus anzutake]|uniref:uncharacterized protein n=1 Tax=Cantharellus anzutake TaxID=1750568 RepID=UPI00190339EC|nr:uncharacterized protein EI90DRAFT_3011932 [Cantharellus anzutake]KAF8341306.1 hypothetical protein EI90DRAFT_3011932 [Cantharellus anzutake]